VGAAALLPVTFGTARTLAAGFALADDRAGGFAVALDDAGFFFPTGSAALRSASADGGFEPRDPRSAAAGRAARTRREDDFPGVFFLSAMTAEYRRARGQRQGFR